VSHNQISELKGIGNLVLLKKLDLSFNRVAAFKDFVCLYLNSLNLANNSIATIDQIFLPCLQYLQLDNNKLEGRGKGIAFLPNLKMLNIDDNRL
jgi:Leucine-rich repeat (LRR) protein